jgi:hypothetical protein
MLRSDFLARLRCVAPGRGASGKPRSLKQIGFLDITGDTFGLAGLCCSAVFPLCISLSGQQFPGFATAMCGKLIAFYQAGYGIAAFGVRPLREFIGLSYRVIYSFGSLIAAAMFGTALAVLAWGDRVEHAAMKR